VGLIGTTFRDARRRSALGIYVVGMHRSWTSALSRAVGQIVGYSGVEEAESGNEAGHWENPGIRRHLDSLLHSFGSTWDAPPAANVAWDALPARHHRHLSRRIAELGEGTWVLKDPRLCLALDAFLQLPQPRASVINIVREPSEVAASLLSRSGIPLEVGHALWERHVIGQLSDQAARPQSAFWVRQGDLARDPQLVLGRVAAWLEFEGWSLPEGGLSEAVRGVRPARVPARDDTPEGHSGAELELLGLFDGLSGASPARPIADAVPALSPGSAAALDRWRPIALRNRHRREARRRLHRLEPLVRPVDALRHRPAPRRVTGETDAPVVDASRVRVDQP
jgi:hypothetical protein